MAYSLGRKAEADLNEIYRYGRREFGQAAAERYFAELRRTFEFLSDYPRAARERQELAPPVRVHPCKSHLIIYVIEGADIRIVRVRHGREDWSAES